MATFFMPFSLFAQDMEICDGDSITLQLSDDVHGEIFWQKSADGQSWEFINTISAQRLNFKPTEDIYTRAAIVDGECDTLFSSERHTKINTTPNPKLELQTTKDEIHFLYEQIEFSTKDPGNWRLFNNNKLVLSSDMENDFFVIDSTSNSISVEFTSHEGCVFQDRIMTIESLPFFPFTSKAFYMSDQINVLNDSLELSSNRIILDRQLDLEPLKGKILIINEPVKKFLNIDSVVVEENVTTILGSDASFFDILDPGDTLILDEDLPISNARVTDDIKWELDLLKNFTSTAFSHKIGTSGEIGGEIGFDITKAILLKGKTILSGNTYYYINYNLSKMFIDGNVYFELKGEVSTENINIKPDSTSEKLNFPQKIEKQNKKLKVFEEKDSIEFSLPLLQLPLQAHVKFSPKLTGTIEGSGKIKLPFKIDIEFKESYANMVWHGNSAAPELNYEIEDVSVEFLPEDIPTEYEFEIKANLDLDLGVEIFVTSKGAKTIGPALKIEPKPTITTKIKIINLDQVNYSINLGANVKANVIPVKIAWPKNGEINIGSWEFYNNNFDLYKSPDTLLVGPSLVESPFVQFSDGVADVEVQVFDKWNFPVIIPTPVKFKVPNGSDDLINNKNEDIVYTGKNGIAKATWQRGENTQSRIEVSAGSAETDNIEGSPLTIYACPEELEIVNINNSIKTGESISLNVRQTIPDVKWENSKYGIIWDSIPGGINNGFVHWPQEDQYVRAKFSNVACGEIYSESFFIDVEEKSLFTDAKAWRSILSQNGYEVSDPRWDSEEISVLRAVLEENGVDQFFNNRIQVIVLEGFSHIPEEIEDLTELNEIRLTEGQITSLPESIGNLSNLIRLNLAENSLASLPDSMGNLSNLKKLWLYGNSLTSLPESIGNLSNLDELHLSVNSLTSLPESIGNLSNLKILRLYINSLTSLPESIGNLSNLIELYLDRNSLASLPESMGNLSNLKNLELWRNSFTSFPESIVNLSNLEILNLAENSLTSLPENIGNLSNLEGLSFRKNSLTSLPASIVNLSNLEGLNLEENSLTSLPESIGNLSNLRWLSLDKNSLTSLPASIVNLSNLESLNLVENSLTSLPESIGNLSNLRWLFLDKNSLTSLPASIGNLSNLEKLYSEENSLTSLPESIGNLSNLVDLYLAGNSLTSLPKSIGNLSNLRWLFLHYNNLKCLPQSVWDLRALYGTYIHISNTYMKFGDTDCSN